MDDEQRPLLARHPSLLSMLKCSWIWILVSIVGTEILLISFIQYSGHDQSSRRSYIPQGHQKNCVSPRFKSQTLKLLREMPLADIFGVDTVDTFENSDIIADPSGDSLYCVLDNTFSVARVGRTLGRFLSEDKSVQDDALLPWTGGHPSGDSGFEYIAFNSSSGRYIVGRESEKMSDGSFRSRIFDVTFDEDRTFVHDSCVSDFSFSHKNKGFEGAFEAEVQGRSLLIGLCEGNYCKGGHKGRKSGHGRLVVMEREVGNKCRYKTVDVIDLPKEVDFQDYSAISVWNGSMVGIASQENAAIFVGDIDLGKLKIINGVIYDLPRNDNCEIKYCNVEGLYFLRHDVVVTVTDSMKRKGKQHFRCRAKDESIQVFQIPPT